MINVSNAQTVTTLHALIVALKAKLTELRISGDRTRQHELLADINLIHEQVGDDVVQHVGLLVARKREVVLSIYDGRGCSKNRLSVSTQLDQLIRLKGIALCPFCEELLVSNVIAEAAGRIAA